MPWAVCLHVQCRQCRRMQPSTSAKDAELCNALHAEPSGRTTLADKCEATLFSTFLEAGE
eukprot:11278605-Prorocentrum_lima.AAC.1